MMGKIHSVQSLGTVDGPGVRYVIFLHGCNLRCKCCHNPDTWEMTAGSEISAKELIEKAERFREYFGESGGITVSGGEPLLQAEFVTEIFSLAREKGINTCLDTSGSLINDKVERLLNVTDRVLLDIKYTSNETYLENAGCTLDSVLGFLKILDTKKIPTVIRQVTIPTVNDTRENDEKLKEIATAFSCVEKIELLPFRKICQTKYDLMKIDFPFKNIPEPTPEKMKELNELL